MPARLIHDQEHLFVWADTYCCGKGVERDLEGLHRDSRQEQPEGVSGTGSDKALEIGPVIARADQGHGTLPFGTPHPAQEEAMLVLRPDLDRGVRMGGLQRLGQERQVFLKAIWASRSACAWRGRGTLGVKPRRLSHTQPR